MKKGQGRPRVLVLAGLDGSGRAGLLADAEALRENGAEPVLCATSIAAQSAKKLVLLEPVAPRAIEAQVEAALADGPVQAIKLGAMARSVAVETLLRLLRGPLLRVPRVVDPVLATSSGGSLFDGKPEELLPLFEGSALVTPNLVEASLLSGMEISDEAAMPEAASRIALRCGAAVLLKGGHLQGAPADLLLAQGEVRWFRHRRQKGKRGTGCRLASAIAAGLGAGQSIEVSVARGLEYLERYLAA